MYAKTEDATADWLKEMRKGYLRIAVLTLLSRRPHHGYEIMKEIRDRTDGFWSPTSGGIYPILQSLEDSGYILGEWSARKRRRRKTYRITETGRPLLQQALTRQNQIAIGMSDLFREFMKDVLDVRSAPTPPMPNFFSVFLEDKEAEDPVSMLEDKRVQIEDCIRSLRKELDAVNVQLGKTELQKKHAPRKRLD